MADIGKISDGYHTFDELYRHRAVLFACLCRLNPNISWRACMQSDGELFDDMFIAGMEFPGLGQVSYHIEDAFWNLFDGIPTLTYAPEYDGHTSEDVLKRLEDYFLS